LQQEGKPQNGAAPDTVVYLVDL